MIMRLYLVAVAAAFFTVAPAVAAQPDHWEDDSYLEAEAGFGAALPSGEDVTAMAPAIDRMTGALLDVDVGPIMDAADPRRRNAWRGRRTLRDMAGRDDPYFDARLRGSIYEGAAQMGALLDAFAAAAPAMRHSLREMEREIDRAVADARTRYRSGRRYRD